MASTVEQSEIKSIGPLSSTLELFDSFKSQEDKDSDEESFHLPLLGCDDDNDIENGKEDIQGTSVPNGETEDDILNKFESNTPEVADIKEEHLLLHEEDDTDKEKTGTTSDQNKKGADTSNNEMLVNKLEVVDEAEESFENTEQQKEETENSASDIKNHEDVKEETNLKSKIIDSVKMNLNFNEGENFESTGEDVFKIDDLDALFPENENLKSSEKDDIDNSKEITEEVYKNTTPISEADIEQENPQIENIQKDQQEEQLLEENKLSPQPEKENIVPERDTKLDDDQTKDDEVEFMELDVQDVPQIDIDDHVEDSNEDVETEEIKETKNGTENTLSISDVATDCTVMNVDVVEDDKSVVDNNSDTKEGDSGNKQDTDDKLEENSEDKMDKKVVKDKCEESEVANAEVNENQSNKDEECDDLLDISVIRDADEDNASAIEDITDTLSNEKSDDNDEQDDKQENDVDEIVSSDKDENMDFDESNTNSCDQDTTTTDIGVSEPTSDGENKDSEITQSESESQHAPSVDDVTEISSNQSFVDTDNKSEDQVIEKSTDVKDVNEKDVPVEIADEKNKTAEEKPASPLAGKRSLPENDSKESEPIAIKKMRMSDELVDENKSKKSQEEKKKTIDERRKAISAKNDKLKTLITFEKFMKQRNLGEGKLSRSDIEQLVLQKVCQVLIDETVTGELHQKIKKQELMLENQRRDIQQLSKQTRDLDIVNKKLMNELRTQNISQKPLVPLKITRSVGLQVKLNIGNESAARRKSHPGQVTTPRTPTTPVTPGLVNRQRNVQANNNVVRQVSSGTSTTPSARKTPATAPILTQALQTRPTPTAAVATPPTVVKRPLVMRAKSTESQKSAAPGVIDLTDEDDKTAKNVSNNLAQKTLLLNKNGMIQNKVKVQSKTVAVGQVKTTTTGTKGLPTRTVTTIPQGVRLTPAQMKNGIAIPASVVTSTAGGQPQLMYVVQPGSTGNSGTGVQKAVLLNFQAATNGVLTSALNGSTVSMIPSKSSNIQLKSIPSSARKHPAPLPLPPPTGVNASLKPLLPKPHLSIRKTDNGIILQWRMPYNLDIYEGIASYQLFAYQETNAPPSTDMWRKVGDVKALALPMACTLTQFADKNKYYFAVRSVDVHKRIGAFSDPEEISL